MNKLPIDLDSLPEPLKSMAQNLDPKMIENMLTMYDPATLSLMMNSVFAMLKDTLPPDQLDSLKEMMDNLLKILPQKS
ncbi:MAG: hypothetical protein M1130_13840 [Actinobacteria bacterium]|nr:hypothetical protein [Actinomycetota bacterium]